MFVSWCNLFPILHTLNKYIYIYIYTYVLGIMTCYFQTYAELIRFMQIVVHGISWFSVFSMLS